MRFRPVTGSLSIEAEGEYSRRPDIGSSNGQAIVGLPGVYRQGCSET